MIRRNLAILCLWLPLSVFFIAAKPIDLTQQTSQTTTQDVLPLSRGDNTAGIIIPKLGSETKPLPPPPAAEIDGTFVRIDRENATPVSVVGQESLANHLVGNAGEALKLLPGNMMNSNGGRIGINSISIRGSRSYQVSTLLNGIPLNSPLGVGGGDPSKIATPFLEQVELYRGAAAAFYGNGSSGGALNLVPRNPQSPLYQAHYGYHNYDGHQFLFQVATPLNEEQGLSVGGELVYNPTDIPIVGGDTYDEAFLGNFNLSFFHEEEKFNISFINLIEELHTTELIGNVLQNFQSFHNLNWELSHLLNSPDIEASYSGNFAIRPIDMHWEPSNQSKDQHTTTSLHLNNHFKLDYEWAVHKLHFGTDLNLQFDLGKSTAITEEWLHRETLSPVAGLQIQFATPNERPVGIFEFSTRLSTITGDKTFCFPSTALGLLFYLDPEEKISLKSSFSNGFRAPSISELYFATSGYDPNPKLSEEKSLSFDSGLIYKPVPEIELGALYFYRNEKNAIYWLDNSSQNLPDLDFHGTELWLNIDYQLDNGCKVGWINNYQYIFGKYKNGEWFDLTHPHLFKSSFYFGYKDYLNLSNYIAVYSGFADIEPFCQWDIKAKIGVENFYLIVGMDNILNQKLRFHQYTAPLGRGFTIALEYKNEKSPTK